jgi:hypothetical protein
MPIIPNAVIHQIFVPFILMFFFVGGIFCFAVGVGLIAVPNQMLKFFAVMNRWVTLRRYSKTMAVQRDSWPVFQKYRRIVAFAIIAGAVFSLFNLLARIDTHAIAALIGLRLYGPLSFVQWLVDSAWWVMVLGSVMAIVVGAMLVFTPQPLAALEKLSARWVSTRELSKSGSVMHTRLDQWVAAHTKTAGSIVMALAAIELIDIGVLMF